VLEDPSFKSVTAHEVSVETSEARPQDPPAKGKSDPTYAIAAARAALSGQADDAPEDQNRACGSDPRVAAGRSCRPA
jgi:hypothetical protein